MAGMLYSTKVVLLLAILGGILNGTASMVAPKRDLPHMCDASNESSEEKCLETPQNVAHPIQGPLMATQFDVKYILYTADNKQYTFTYDSFDSNKVPFIPGAPFKVLIHGFLNSAKTTFPVNVREAYMKRMKEHTNETYNVLVYDWGKGACTHVLQPHKFYIHAVENVQDAGRKLGDMLVKLHTMNIMNVTTDVHMIGHSLGSHVAGQAGRRVYNLTGSIPWRTSALDPAGPWFKRDKIFAAHNPFPRLHRNRVHFLDVYHTSEMFGSNEEMGDVDFFINGGELQESCKVEYKLPILGFNIVPFAAKIAQVCSHNYATEIFAKSINEKILGCTGCYSFDEYKKGDCTCEDEPIMGEFVVEHEFEGYPLASGTVYVITKKDTSFANNYKPTLNIFTIIRSIRQTWQGLCIF